MKFALLFILMISSCCLVKAAAQGNQTDNQTSSSVTSSDNWLSYKEFKALSNEEQIAVFSQLSSPEIYYLVKSSDTENWPVTSYDLVTEENAKEFIVLNENNGTLSFNLSWPKYGGYVPETIASIGDLSGTETVSRDGGDSGYCMCFGRNSDGTLPGNSQRSVPKSSAEVRVGLLDIDRYKKAVDVITGEEFKKDTTEETDRMRIDGLKELGFTEESAITLMSDYNAWLTRPEIVGKDNIAEGAKSVGHQVEQRYGYYGKTAPWKVSDLELVGGSNQMNTVFSWGTLNSSGLISEAGTETIN